MYSIGLDIGTTHLCASIVRVADGKIMKTLGQLNDSNVEGGHPFERMQSPARILELCKGMLDSLLAEFSDVACIGISGQMHGVVYVDKDGNALSNLYTWQDGSANELYNGLDSYAGYMQRITGYPMASGFGNATLFYHHANELLPAGAAKACTIGTYVAMKLGGKTEPVMHSSEAASFGLFDLEHLTFDFNAMGKLNMPAELMPKTVKDFDLVGDYHGIPVAAGIGDNQAGYLGCVADMDNSVLVNFGTGSQVSFLTTYRKVTGAELRPCFGDKYLFVGSALCGGRAFAQLERFFRETAKFVTGKDPGNVYAQMDALLAEDFNLPEDPLFIATRFAGTRQNPDARGSILGIGTENFTPRHLIWGFLCGMADELRDFYAATGEKHQKLIGAGNGIRKNKALQKIMMGWFEMPLSLPMHEEEAAYGAALYAMTAAGVVKSIAEAQSHMTYEIAE